MAKKKKEKPKSEIKGLKVLCGKCGKESEITFSYHDFHASDTECELCGSHGSITFDFKCPACNSFETVEIDSW